MRPPHASRTSSFLATAIAPLLFIGSFAVADRTHAEITLQDRHSDVPLVLDRPEDYIIRNVRISGLYDQSALTLSGPIRSVIIENSKFGNIRAGGNRKAVALEAVGASVGNVKVTDSAFYNSENQLVSLRVTVEVCVVLVRLDVEHRNILIEQERHSVERCASALFHARCKKMSMVKRLIGIGLVLYFAHPSHRFDGRRRVDVIHEG